MNSLALAVWMMLFVDPRNIFSPGLQMSAAAVAALILAGERWATRRFAWPLALLMAGTVAWVATAPISAFHFHRLSLVAPVANLVFLPIYCFIILPFCLLALVTHWLLPPLSHLFFYLISLATDAVLYLMGRVGGPGWIAIHLARNNAVAVGILSWGWLVCLLLVLPRWGWRRAGGIAFAALLAAAAAYSQGPGDRFAVHVLDVGKGLSQVVEMGGGMAAVIDAGPSLEGVYSAGERIVAPFLWHSGYSSIRYLIISHPQADHAGGAEYLLENFEVSSLILASAFKRHPLFQRLARTARERGAEVVWVDDRWEGKAGEAMFVALASKKCGCSSVNDRGLVVLVRYRGRRFLFTGDITRCREECLVSSKDVGAIDLLVVPHHGSITSSSPAFLQATAPSLAVIPSGPWNLNLQGREQVAKRLSHLGAEVLRIDKEGTVSVTLDGGEISIHTYKERGRRKP